MREYKKIEIICRTPKELSVDELGRFFYYLNNIYKILYFGAKNRTIDHRFIHLKKLPKEERLKVSIIKKSSPLQFEILIPLIITSFPSYALLFLEIIKLIRGMESSKEIKSKINNISSQNEKLQREIEKLNRLKEIKIIEVKEK